MKPKTLIKQHEKAIEILILIETYEQEMENLIKNIEAVKNFPKVVKSAKKRVKVIEKIIKAQYNRYNNLKQIETKN